MVPFSQITLGDKIESEEATNLPLGLAIAILKDSSLVSAIGLTELAYAARTVAGHVEKGDLIVLTIGEPIGCTGGTNTLKIVRVGEHQIL